VNWLNHMVQETLALQAGTIFWGTIAMHDVLL
jgi:hypothetical protein